MRTDILEYLEKEVYRRCEKPSNKFGMSCYCHITAVVRNAEILADKFGADKDIVMIAAWLHDIASVTDYELYEKHHIYGANIAEEILLRLSYDKWKIKQVQACIRNHRGSVKTEKLSKEEICVADADAISHFDSVPSLFYLAYVQRNMEIEEGVAFVKSKLERNWGKLSEKSKEIYRDKYRNVLELLKSF